MTLKALDGLLIQGPLPPTIVRRVLRLVYRATEGTQNTAVLWTPNIWPTSTGNPLTIRTTHLNSLPRCPPRCPIRATLSISPGTVTLLWKFQGQVPTRTTRIRVYRPHRIQQAHLLTDNSCRIFPQALVWAHIKAPLSIRLSLAQLRSTPWSRTQPPYQTTHLSRIPHISRTLLRKVLEMEVQTQNFDANIAQKSIQSSMNWRKSPFAEPEHSLMDTSKHLRKHTKPLTCKRCPEAFAQAKDLHRHLWSNHPVYAAENNIPKDEKVCADCGLVCRSDNYKRHQQRYGHGPYRTWALLFLFGLECVWSLRVGNFHLSFENLVCFQSVHCFSSSKLFSWTVLLSLQAFRFLIQVRNASLVRIYSLLTGCPSLSLSWVALRDFVIGTH